MKLTCTLIVAASILSVTASPYGGGSCAGGQVVSCCNTSDKDQAVGNNILGLLNGVLSPGNCSPVSVPIVGAVLQQYCGNNVAQCCDNAQGGLVNINAAQCVAIPF